MVVFKPRKHVFYITKTGDAVRKVFGVSIGKISQHAISCAEFTHHDLIEIGEIVSCTEEYYRSCILSF